MPGEIYFNGREWRTFGCSEQQVKFLELLYNRAGGAQTVELSLQEVNNFITNVSSEQTSLRTVIRRLEHRINQLENEH